MFIFRPDLTAVMLAIGNQRSNSIWEARAPKQHKPSPTSTRYHHHNSSNRNMMKIYTKFNLATWLRIVELTDHNNSKFRLSKKIYINIYIYIYIYAIVEVKVNKNLNQIFFL